MKQLSSLLKISVSVLFLLLSLTASGGDPYRPAAGAGEAGMGYLCLKNNGLWTSFHNQAHLAKNSSAVFGFNYQDRYGLNELGTRTAALSIPCALSSIGAIYSHFGYSDYKRDMIGLASGLMLSEKLSAGVQIDYFSERTFGEYNNNQSVTFEAGILFYPQDKLVVGIHLFNPVPNSIRKSFLPSTITAGTGIFLNDNLFAGVEAEMSTGQSLLIRSGFEYQTARKFFLRGGYITENSAFTIGMGYLTKVVQIDLGFNTHEKLGLTSSVSLIFKIM